jgi:hypothetical protein
MPCAYRVDHSSYLVLARWWGVVTTADALEFVAFLRTQPTFRPDMRELSDAREVTSVKIESAVIRSLPSPFGPGARRAIVASDPAVFGPARQYELSHDQVEDIHVFSSMDEALRWLGLENDRAEILARLSELKATEPQPGAE